MTAGATTLLAGQFAFAHSRSTVLKNMIAATFALRPAPKARSAAHPQERQHSAAEGGTRDRVRPAEAVRLRRLRRTTSRDRHPGWAETRGEIMAVVCRRRLRGSGRHAPRARPEGGRTKKLAVLDTVLILKIRTVAPP
jgi:hypothetical protein